MRDMERYAGPRNVLIILAIAAAVYFVPSGGKVADTVAAVLGVAFGVVIALFAGRLYQEHRVALYSLGDHRRAILYGAIAVAMADGRGRNRVVRDPRGRRLHAVRDLPLEPPVLAPRPAVTAAAR